MSSYKLCYFALRGRAEITRLLFAAAGQNFEDVRISMEEFPKIKETLPTGQLPTFEVGGKVVCQSLAIARYVAREFGLAGKNNMEQLLVDQVVDTMNDYLGLFFDAYFDEEKKQDRLQKYLEETTPKVLKTLDKFLQENNGGDGFFVGQSMTMADLFVYETLTNVVQMDSKILDGFRKIAAHRQRVESLPKIQEYLKKRPVTEV